MFGSVSLSVEISLGCDVQAQSLAKVTATSVQNMIRCSVLARDFAGVERVTSQRVGHYLPQSPSRGGSTNQDMLLDEDLRNLLVSLARLRRFFNGHGGLRFL